MARKNDDPLIFVFVDGLFLCFLIKIFFNADRTAIQCLLILCVRLSLGSHVMQFVLTVMSCSLYWQPCHVVCIGSHVMQFVWAVMSCRLYLAVMSCSLY